MKNSQLSTLNSQLRRAAAVLLCFLSPFALRPSPCSAEVKLSELPVASSGVSTDRLVILSDAAGTPVTKTITLGNVSMAINPDSTGPITLLIAGDSIGAGFGLSAGQDWPSVLVGIPASKGGYFAGRTTKINTCLAGRTIADITAAYAAEVHPHRPAANGGDGGSRVILLLGTGTNDNLSDAATVLAAVESYIATAHADGIEVWALTAPMRATPGSVPAYNQLLRASPLPDRVVEVEFLLNDPTNLALFQSGALHPNAQGSALIAQQVNQAAWGRGRGETLRLNGMSYQDPAAVAITGGSISVAAFGISKASGNLQVDFTTAASTTNSLYLKSGTNWVGLSNAGDGTFGILTYDGSSFHTVLGINSSGVITSGTWSGSFGAVSGANLTSLNASNISSGTLAVAQGGTGAGTAAAAVTALGAQPKVLLGFVAATEVHASYNSATLVDSTAGQLTLGAGTYLVTASWLVGDSAVASAGSKTALRFSGTATIVSEIGMYASGTDVTGFLTAAIYPNTAGITDVIQDGSKAIYRHQTALFTVTAGGTVYLQSAQGTANTSDHKLYSGSYVKATKIE